MNHRKPDFFIVGAPKCGTTSMDAYLSRHPDVGMASAKESHHLADDFLLPSNPLRDRETYLELFSGVQDRKRLGESSVYYLLSATAARNIHALNPDARILIHLRNPVDLLYSHHYQLLFEGFQDIEDFEAAIEAGDDGRLADEDERVRARVCMARDYLGLVDFVPQIERYRALFPPENIRIVLFDDLKEDSETVFVETLRFLGIDSDFRVAFDVHNPNKVVRSVLLRRLLRNPPAWLSFPSRMLFPLSLRNEIKRRVKRANTRFVSRPPLPPEVRARLTQRLAPRVRELEACLGRELPSWRGESRDASITS